MPSFFFSGVFGGNEGTVNAFYANLMFVIVSNPSKEPEQPALHLAQIDITNAILISAPPLGKVGLGLLEQMAWV